jgi:hypothetical protein
MPQRTVDWHRMCYNSAELNCCNHAAAASCCSPAAISASVVATLAITGSRLSTLPRKAGDRCCSRTYITQDTIVLWDTTLLMMDANMQEL